MFWNTGSALVNVRKLPGYAMTFCDLGDSPNNSVEVENEIVTLFMKALCIYIYKGVLH